VPENIVWIAGAEGVSYFEHPSRGFSKAFCSGCGSALPFVNKSGRALIVPAGSLFDKVEHVPEANIFIDEKAGWLKDGLSAKEFSRFSE